MLAGSGQAPEDTIRLLKEELETARRDLRIKAGQYDAANEELRAANRQLLAVNEEYRAAAAKLEAGRNGLQSVNEELRTVNAELKAEFGRVSHAHAELQNLMEAADAGTLFLDRELRIERFTPRIAELLEQLFLTAVAKAPFARSPPPVAFMPSVTWSMCPPRRAASPFAQLP